MIAANTTCACTPTRCCGCYHEIRVSTLRHPDAGGA